MAAFIFPNPADQTTVENPITGVKYEWREDSGKWVVSTIQTAENLDESLNDLAKDVNDNTLEISQHSTRLDSLEAKPAAKDYMLGTDKTSNRNAPAAAGPQIELVDSEGFFSNVKIEGVNGINVTSTASSIVIDGSDVQAIADLDDYYTKTEVDATDQYLQDQIDDLTITKGESSTYTLNEVGIAVGVRPGEFFIDNAVVSSLKFISLSPQDDNGNNRPIGEEGDVLEINGPNNVSYRYSIEQISEGIAAVDYTIGTADDDVLIPGTAYSIFIYPKNGSSASVDYVNSQLATKLPLTGGNLSGNLVLDTGSGLYTKEIIKSTRNTGYAFQVKPNDTGAAAAYIHTNGNAEFARVKVRETPIDNSDLTTKGYVDTQIGSIPDVDLSGVLPLTGGTLTGNLVLDSGSGLYTSEIIKSTRNTGYAFQVKPDNLDDVAHIHTNGNAKFAESTFTSDVKFEGNLSFTNGGTINVSNGNTALSGRASLDIKSAADYPVVISSGSSYKKVLAFYGYDGSADDNRGEVASINAKGEAHFKAVYSNDEQLATQTYVDNKVAGTRSIHYGDGSPTESNNGDLWVDTTHMRLLMRVNGAWVNPDRDDSDSLENRINTLEQRISQLEGN